MSGSSSGGGGSSGGADIQVHVRAALATEREALTGAQAAVAAWQQALGAGCSLEELSELYLGEDSEDEEDEED